MILRSEEKFCIVASEMVDTTVNRPLEVVPLARLDLNMFRLSI